MKPATPSKPVRASVWLERLAAPDAELRDSLRETYGVDDTLHATRSSLIRHVLLAYIDEYGDGAVRIHRAPGRINLRGMHVDTHGGWLNLATHQREVIVVSGAGEEGTLHAANIDTAHAPCTVEFGGRDAATGSGWSRYVCGVARRVAEDSPDTAVTGMRCMVGSDLPVGASLSSSAALCIAMIDAIDAWNGTERSDADRILAARDAEWYAGARTGTGDQAAIILGRAGVLTHTTLLAEDFSLDQTEFVSLPEECRVLVVDSLTSRELSGAARVDYARNRFAYSMALHILNYELPDGGQRISRLSDAAPDTLGGNEAVYELLERIPDSLTLDEIAGRYAPPSIDESYEQYFGTLSEEARPTSFALRGPLLFALAESERARLFPAALTTGPAAGMMMCHGHDGDRVVDSRGEPFSRRVLNEHLQDWKNGGRAIANCPGDYGASTPALDFLVDAAMDAGAWGASLTGAGMGGAIVVLCPAENADGIVHSIRDRMATAAYADRSGMKLDRDDPRLEEVVLINTAIAGAGELAY